MKRVVTFGEIMIRFDAPDQQRLRQVIPGTLRATFAGAEANVAVSIAYLGGSTRFVTALPDNMLTDACIAQLKGFGVDTDFIIRSRSGRFGAYFVETGANQRPSTVLYDRDGSSISEADTEMYDWDGAFADAHWLHITGITPALSRKAADASILAVKTAHEKGLTVSCDLNFRRKLWRWSPGTPPEQLAEETMRKVLPFVDVLIANEEDAADVLGLRAEGADIQGGVLSLDGYVGVAERIAEQFSNLKTIATTLRQSISATHNNWGAMLYDTETASSYASPDSADGYRPFQITSIVDRVGGGDSFAAALIFALISQKYGNLSAALDFATAASCLAHSIRGDFNLSSRAEVEALMRGSASGRVIR